MGSDKNVKVSGAARNFRARKFPREAKLSVHAVYLYERNVKRYLYVRVSSCRLAPLQPRHGHSSLLTTDMFSQEAGDRNPNCFSNFWLGLGVRARTSAAATLRLIGDEAGSIACQSNRRRKCLWVPLLRWDSKFRCHFRFCRRICDASADDAHLCGRFELGPSEWLDAQT